MNMRFAGASALAAGFALVASGALAQAGPGGYEGHMWGEGMHGWFFGPLIMVFWIAVAVAAVVLVLRLLGVSRHRCCGHDKRGGDALAILRERFARGEIDKAEFEDRKAALER